MTKAEPSAHGGGALGAPLPRLEDRRFLTGQARFADNLSAADALWMSVVRSSVGHGVVREVATAEALAVPGVRAVHLAGDLAAAGLGTLPCVSALAPPDVFARVPRFALATDRVRFVGEPVAIVVAESEAAGNEAAERVDLAIEAAPAVADIEAALAANAAALHPEAPHNVAFHIRRGDAGRVAAAMCGAAHVVECTLVNNRVTAAPIEPRAGIARFDAKTGRFMLTLSAQGLHAIRAQLATVFDLPVERFALCAPDVGGGFGLKNFLYPEWVLLAFAARRHDRPVRWCATRGEDMSAAAHGRDACATVRLGLDAQGRFLALHADVVGNMGAYLSGGGPNVLTRAFPTAFGGMYRIPAVSLEARGVYTNTVPVDAYRGAGKPVANYLTERVIDLAARRLGLDPFSLRARNALERFPYRTALGSEIDCGALGERIAQARAQCERSAFESRRALALADGIALGRGVSCFLETARGAPSEGATVGLEPDGSVSVAIGTECNGQGHETAFAQVTAERLGVPVDRVRLVQADTDRVPMGHGHGGARSMHMGGAALVRAADALLAAAREQAARLLQTTPAGLRFEAGRFESADAKRGMSLGELAWALVEEREDADAAAPAEAALLSAFARVDDAPFTFPNGCHVAEAACDLETGVVTLERYLAFDDFGRLVNPMLTAGQVHGGIAQGIGQALHEHVVYEADSAQLLSGSFLDYCLPRALDLPAFTVHLEGPVTAANPLGVKGAGQAGAIAAPQCIVSAVLDALAPHGVEHLDMPLTSERIWRALRDSHP